MHSGNYAPGEGLNPDEDYSGWNELDSTRAIRDINKVYDIVESIQLGSDEW